MIFYDEIYSEHSSVTHALPEGEPTRARGAGDLGPAKAESPALFLCLYTVTIPLAALESCALNLSLATMLQCVC